MYPARVLAVTALILGSIPGIAWTLAALLVAILAVVMAFNLHKRVAALEEKVQP